jgi:pyrroloquinoline quinone (PQQ) biosynthesis protein C
MLQGITQADFKSDAAYVNRRTDVDPVLGKFADEKMDYILNHRALEHPFFNYYAKFGLPAEKSKTLYLETRHYFKFLPFYICAIAGLVCNDDRAGNNILRFIAFNANDELGTEYSHSDMYKDFMFKKGITQKQLDNYKPLPSTIALNEGIRTLYSTQPVARALGALYADETLSAGLVSKYNSGLAVEGLSDDDRFFWILHCEWEVGHSNAVFNIVEPYLQTEQDRQAFSEGIDQYLFLMEKYWDGIEKLIGY